MSDLTIAVLLVVGGVVFVAVHEPLGAGHARIVELVTRRRSEPLRALLSHWYRLVGLFLIAVGLIGTVSAI